MVVVYPPLAFVVTVSCCAATAAEPMGNVEKLMVFADVPRVVVAPAMVVFSDTPEIENVIDGDTVAALAMTENAVSVFAP